MTLMQIELTFGMVLSIIAICLSAYSISVSKKRNDTTDMKELTRVITELVTEMGIVKKAIMGTPTINEQVAVGFQKMDELDRRITALEKRDGK